MHEAPVELRSISAFRAAAGGDSLLLWTGQGLRPRVRAWTLGGAIVVACPELSRRDRLAVQGPATAAAALVGYALAELGPTFRPVGDAGLIRAIVGLLPELEVVAEFGWMETRVVPAPGPSGGDGAAVDWMTEDRLPEVEALLAEAFPDSNAHPSRPGYRRWAGATLRDGTLVSVGADAWTAPGVGFVAGVATRRGYRNRGAASAVCRFLLRELVAQQGCAALMVDAENRAAITVYERLGMSFRRVAGARLRSGI